MATVPDFGGLASAQKAANDQATNQTNQANRVNQYNPMGSLTWSQDGSGNWTQNSNLSGDAQNLYNQSMWGQSNLAGQIGQGVNTSSLPSFGSTNLTGNLGGWGTDPTQGLMNFGGDPRQGLMDFGATDLTSNLGAMPQVGQYNQQVIDAWNALQNPGLSQAETAQRQRLAAQGITLGSNISNTSERNLGNVRTDASNKAILAGYQQGNTEYGQALQGRAQRYGENLGQSQNQTAQRAAQYGENLGWSNMQNAQRGQQYGENLGRANLANQERQQGYNENLGQSNLMNQQRQQAMAEETARYNALLSGSSNLQASRDSLNPNKWAANVPASAAFQANTIYGAAQDSFNAQRQNENADIAQKNANISTATGLASSVMNSPTAMNGIGSAASSLWGGAKNLFSGWGANDWNSAYNVGSMNGWGTNDTPYGSTAGWDTWAQYGGGGD